MIKAFLLRVPILLGLALLSMPATAGVQFSTTVRNARADAIETAIGTSAVLKLVTGSQPANCAASDPGTVVATMTLPSDWMSAASSGVKSQLGTWSDSSADATGTAAHYRIFESTGTTCHIQGSVTATGGGGNLTLDNTAIVAGQQVDITSFSFTEGNP